jgi:hypothetical protein
MLSVFPLALEILDFKLMKIAGEMVMTLWCGGGSSWRHVRCVKYWCLWGRWTPEVVRRPHGAICGKHLGCLGEV